MSTDKSHVVLLALLADCEDKPASFLDRLAEEWPADEALLLHLASFAEAADPVPQLAASRLLKRYLTAGNAFSAAVSLRLLDLCP